MNACTYNVGDKVVINERTGCECEYRFYFTDEMAELEGRVYEITEIDRDERTDSADIEDDGFKYKLSDEACEYSWASSMFCPLSSMFEPLHDEGENECKPICRTGDYVRILPRIYDKGMYNGAYVDEMAKYAGCVTRIEKVVKAFSDDQGRLHDDGCIYRLECDKGNYAWRTSMFEKMGTTTIEPHTDMDEEMKIQKVSLRKRHAELNFKV